MGATKEMRKDCQMPQCSYSPSVFQIGVPTVTTLKSRVLGTWDWQDKQQSVDTVKVNMHWQIQAEPKKTFKQLK